MSEIREVEVLFKDQSCLVDSLKQIGYQPQVFKNGQTMETYYQNKQKPKVHVLIPREQFNGIRDIGFEKTKDGFVMHADDYDYGAHGKKFKLEKLNKAYCEKKLKNFVSKSSRYFIMSRKERQNGTVQIELRVIN